ncbi:hypothetical protein AA471_25520 [Salmonella enterica subsp. enterica]|nr:hypothetical protein [Salmonella enterica subsp. enterica]ECI0980203.1 hypothetical protein [Salmonella enterica subsp. enterica serovar Newport]ECI2306526.1 hypothetical protein [Salmonella enterica subsp. enterica serovar Infantis]EDQ2991399.1 hypothetical protein [Salmonella enterica subsp. enterica]EDT3088642.1 hypothetical protein [Salmonella enterica subsp. enterica serovar Newport]
MKLSPEAKQAVKTAIEQLRLLLVDDAMDTVREAASKHWTDAGKSEDEKIIISGNCRVEGKTSSGSIEGDIESLERLKKTSLHGAKAIIDEIDEKLKTQVAILQAEKRPDNEAQEVEKIISDIMRIAASSELLRQLSR